jgi:hypothetical protein
MSAACITVAVVCLSIAAWLHGRQAGSSTYRRDKRRGAW